MRADEDIPGCCLMLGAVAILLTLVLAGLWRNRDGAGRQCAGRKCAREPDQRNQPAEIFHDHGPGWRRPYLATRVRGGARRGVPGHRPEQQPLAHARRNAFVCRRPFPSSPVATPRSRRMNSWSSDTTSFEQIDSNADKQLSYEELRDFVVRFGSGGLRVFRGNNASCEAFRQPRQFGTEHTIVSDRRHDLADLIQEGLQRRRRRAVTCSACEASIASIAMQHRGSGPPAPPSPRRGRRSRRHHPGRRPPTRFPE